MRLQKKSQVIILVMVILVIALAGARIVFGGKSPETIEREAKVKTFAIEGWRIKNDARLYDNREKIINFKQKLINYYSAESGELAKQQRLINAWTAADITAANGDSSGKKILGFRVTDVSFVKEKITNENAELTANIEYFTEYDTQAQTYRTFGKNDYSWQLKKEKGKWKITKEELVTAEE